MWSRIVWPKCAICRHCADFAPVGSRKTCPSPLGRRRQGECQSGRSGLRPSPCAGGFPPQRPLKIRPHSTRCSQYPIIAARRLLSTSKCFLRGPSWTDRIMILQRFSSWFFVALRGQESYDLAKVFAALRDRPNRAKVFFPSWIKRCSPPPFVDRPNYDLANLSSDKRQRALTPSNWGLLKTENSKLKTRTRSHTGYGLEFAFQPKLPSHRIPLTPAANRSRSSSLLKTCVDTRIMVPSNSSGATRTFPFFKCSWISADVYPLRLKVTMPDDFP